MHCVLIVGVNNRASLTLLQIIDIRKCKFRERDKSMRTVYSVPRKCQKMHYSTELCHE